MNWWAKGFLFFLQKLAFVGQEERKKAQVIYFFSFKFSNLLNLSCIIKIYYLINLFKIEERNGTNNLK